MEKSSTDIKRQRKTVPTECRICGASAQYSHFGVITCQSCKIFFRRNGNNEQNALKCKFDEHCEININNRHVCAYCRLAKCILSGMQTVMIRSSQSKQNRIKGKSIQHKQFPISNLLQFNQSILTLDQWNRISDVSHCYDEFIGLSFGERYMCEQRALPLKLRFKCTAMKEFIRMSFNENQFIYKKNQDFLSLSSNDRSILLHNTFKYTGYLSTNFIYRQIQLSNYSIFYDNLIVLINQNVISAIKCLVDHLDIDIIIIKLFLIILSFSTMNSEIIPINLSNIKQILNIQNKYIELTWRYIIYKYDYIRAVQCFSHFIRCIFAVHDIAIQTYDVQWLTDTFNNLIQKIEQND